MARPKTSVVSSTRAKDKTIIQFRWGDNPYGFSLEGKGNFYPGFKTELKQFPNMTGNFPVIVTDKDEIVSLELPPEYPRELPEYLNEEPEVRERYRTEMAKIAAESHMANNKIRDELTYHQEKNCIVLVYDSFFDGKRTKKASKLSPIEPESKPVEE